MTPDKEAESVALLPCPFCGNLPMVRTGINGYGHCKTAGCWANRCQTVSLDDSGQVSAWNTRSPLRPQAGDRESHIRDAGEMVEPSHTVTQSHMASLFFQAALSVQADTTLSEDERDAIAAALAPLWKDQPTAEDIAWAEDSARELFGSDGSKRPPIADEVEQ